MDTIGKIRPSSKTNLSPSQRIEAFERLRYLASQQRCGVLIGQRGTGKSDLFSRLENELHREGFETSLINLAGLPADELPQIIAAELGLGLEPNADKLLTWSTLQDYANSVRQSNSHHVLMFDQLDRADVSTAVTFERLLSLFDGAFTCLFASRPKLGKPFRALIKNHCWMQVSLERLSSSDASQMLAQEVYSRSKELHLTQDAIAVVQDATAGRVDKLKRLAELTAIAAEADELREINKDVILSLKSELEILQ
jgi:hypothetical protein